jgi:hypothetical protein
MKMNHSSIKNRFAVFALATLTFVSGSQVILAEENSNKITENVAEAAERETKAPLYLMCTYIDKNGQTKIKSIYRDEFKKELAKDPSLRLYENRLVSSSPRPCTAAEKDRMVAEGIEAHLKLIKVAAKFAAKCTAAALCTAATIYLSVRYFKNKS